MPKNALFLAWQQSMSLNWHYWLTDGVEIGHDGHRKKELQKNGSFNITKVTFFLIAADYQHGFSFGSKFTTYASNWNLVLCKYIIKINQRYHSCYSPSFQGHKNKNQIWICHWTVEFFNTESL